MIQKKGEIYYQKSSKISRQPKPIIISSRALNSKPKKETPKKKKKKKKEKPKKGKCNAKFGFIISKACSLTNT